MPSSDNDHQSSLLIGMMGHIVPAEPNSPYVPSELEARNYLYGLPSKGRLIARSSHDVWKRPTGPHSYLEPKELAPLGFHSLNSELWEGTVAPAMDKYLQSQQVQCTLLLPVRIGFAGQEDLPPPVILVGVIPGTLTSEAGIPIATACRSILLNNGIDDMHVILYESKYHRPASLYKPTVTSSAADIARHPFSTTLGIPICNATTTNIEGTGGFFFIDSNKPGMIFLLTARHVLFHPDNDKNELYTFRDSTGRAKKKVLLMGEEAFKTRCDAIESSIRGEELRLDYFRRQLEEANKVENDDEATPVRREAMHRIEDAETEITGLKQLLEDVRKNWTVEENRVIGHVFLSPPITTNYGKEGFTDDWAVIQVESSMIAKFNLIGNAIDLSSVAVDKLTAWMNPHRANPPSFKYPAGGNFRFTGMVSDQEMYRPDTMNNDPNNDPVTMVLKNGNTSNLTVGRLNTIRAFTRQYFNDNPGEMSRKITILPRNYKSGPFSQPGDSGSAVADGKGRVCGIITGGDGATDVYDCTYVTSINFLIKRLAEHGFKANVLFTAKDL